MSLFSWILKSKKNMAKQNTRRVKVREYSISAHVQNRIADKSRRLRKIDLLINLLSKKSNNSSVYKKGDTLQFDRVNDRNRTITHITQNGCVVKTIRRYHNTKAERNKAYKNFKKE